MRFEEALKYSNFVTCPNNYGILTWIVDPYYGFEYSIVKSDDGYQFFTAMLRCAYNHGLLDRKDWEPFDLPQDLHDKIINSKYAYWIKEIGQE